MDKYEYLAGEDLGLKPGTVEQAILHWVKFLIKGWVKMIKKKDCLKDQKILKLKMKSNWIQIQNH